ncbi:sulfotransferase, partial [bacterium]|nr:sulfotransferase [Candidatus Elulimicrobium humile]
MAKSYKKYYFISGLPRSGSTLLSAILNQNPRFYSGPNSPVVPI